jgi:hypothetical protein
VVDTLTTHFNLLETSNPYTSSLNPKLYAGAQWSFTPRDELGGMVRLDIAEERVQPSLTLNYMHHFGRILTLTGNFSAMANNFANVGLGFVARFGPFQIYMLNDIAWSMLNSRSAKNYNFHLGVNFLFGNRIKTVREDPELIEKK